MRGYEFPCVKKDALVRWQRFMTVVTMFSGTINFSTMMLADSIHCGGEITHGDGNSSKSSRVIPAIYIHIRIYTHVYTLFIFKIIFPEIRLTYKKEQWAILPSHKLAVAWVISPFPTSKTR